MIYIHTHWRRWNFLVVSGLTGILVTVFKLFVFVLKRQKFQLIITIISNLFGSLDLFLLYSPLTFYPSKNFLDQNWITPKSSSRTLIPYSMTLGSGGSSVVGKFFINQTLSSSYISLSIIWVCPNFVYYV